jgi:DNA-binding XRE family transcriptional regulator
MITFCKKKVAGGAAILYTDGMPKRLTVTEKDLAAMAKRFRTASGKNRAQAARELGVARQAVIYAEDRPEKSFFKLRKRMIEKYSPYKVVGPVFWLEKK